MNKMPTNDRDYIKAIVNAAEGEILGEELFLQLSRIFDDENRRKLQILAALERETATRMSRVVHRHASNMHVEDAPRVVEQQIKDAGITSWRAFLVWMRDIVVPYVKIYDDLHQMAQPDDADDLLFLAKHERALLEFLEAELRGDVGAEVHVSRLLG